jgi:hypothetical protein
MRSSQAGEPGAAVETAQPPGRHPAAANPAATRDDSLLAAMYVRMWALASDRPLPRDVPPSELSREELISFWADDFEQAGGRHAAALGDRR